jgi:hypothetical protein
LRRGIPIGNLTSQLFANVYLNELDKFVKQVLQERFYIRYCDDFVILSQNINHLLGLIKKINQFLQTELKLALHKDKVIIRKLNHGVDFLGYVILPHHKVLRTKTKRRMLLRANAENFSSYSGLLKYCDSYNLSKHLVQKAKIR